MLGDVNIQVSVKCKAYICKSSTVYRNSSQGKYGKSQNSFGADPSDHSQVSNVKGLVFFKRNKHTLVSKEFEYFVHEQIVI